MSQRAVFLDRDDTIIDNAGFLGDPSKVKLLPGAATALASLRALGYRLIVVSNQSGVARGMFKETDVEAVNDEMSRQLKEKAGAYIDASYYCPYHPEAVIPEYRVDHDWRKPKPGMLKQAAADFTLDLAQCWMVGDAPRDIAAGVAVGCRTILLRDTDKKPLTEADGVTPNFVVTSLADAARIIVREGRIRPPAAPPPASPAVPPVEPPSSPAQDIPKIAHPPLPDSPVAQSSAFLLTPGETKIEKIMPAKNQVPHTLEKNLEDLVVLLRNQSRNADLRPDFSYGQMASVLFQVLAVTALLIGIGKYFTMKVSFDNNLDIVSAIQSHLGAIVWVLVALFFQTVVISLLLYARNTNS